jgi:hypothetical protein
MGACAGKKKEDRSTSYESKSNSSKKPKSKTKGLTFKIYICVFLTL